MKKVSFRIIKKKLLLIMRFIKIKKALNKNKEFWNKYYKNNRFQEKPSNFAVGCSEKYIKEGTKLLELGCGNGRDAFYFAKRGIDVVALDLAKEEIEYLNSVNKYENCSFLYKDFSTYTKENFFDYVYSRFTLHSVSELQQYNTIEKTYKNLKKGGLFFIEVRSSQDALKDKSTKLSDTEGYTDHYRRFVDYTEIMNDLQEIGFDIVYSIQSNGLAKYKDEDPVVINIVAQKSL